MGVYRKEEMIKTITNFLSSRINLTIFQCILYFIVGYIMGEHLTWPKLGLMFVVMFVIQFITRTKAVADGMVMGHLMKKHNIKTNEFLQRMKDEVDKIDKEDLN